MSPENELPSIITASRSHRRPFWSVMIPTYNGTKYLEQTLKSVLAQGISMDDMQIEVVDDYSTKDSPEEIVNDIGKGRISFFQNPQNVGLLPNWDICIQRAKGQWIHLLHQDDLVMPEFYNKLREGIEPNLSIGAAFCRHKYINEKDELLFLSPLERETSGILSKWLELIATTQRVQCPSIVVNRNTYENLGGFCMQARSAADWEMWKRIATHYPIWYEPQVLASFRLHSASESSRLIRTGENIADVRRSIDISKLYLPSKVSEQLTHRAKENYAIYALDTANNLVDVSDFNAAITQIKEAFKCSYSFNVTRKFVIYIAKWYGKYLFRKSKNV